MSIVDTDAFDLAYSVEQISYKLGAEDMREAICTLYNAIHNKMTPGEMQEIFNTIYVHNVVENNSALDIITKVKNWKKEKQEKEKFEIGDEVECIGTYNMNRGKKCVVLSVREEMKLYDLSNHTTYYTNNFVDYRKTGKHYDSIPIPKGENK